MGVDTKRVQAVLIAAVEADDLEEQSAILDRECASDPELRETVETLLKALGQSGTLLEHSVDGQVDTTPSGHTRTVPFEIVADRKDLFLRTHGRSRGLEDEESAEDDEPAGLDFLEPSATPGSLGRLGHHDVLEVLGRGGFGIVVRAFDQSLHRTVAIKVLSPQLASTSPARKRFLREARAAARIRHANVVQIYAVEERPLPYLVMEYIPGQTLQQRLNQTGPLEAPEILRIGSQIARGLAAAHEQGVIHRDIKPGNILLESGTEQNVKITDFGLARAADDASMSHSGVIAGTPLYMAPEQVKGDPPDPRADLFSLGSVLYTMASGRPPFRAATPLAVLKRVAEDTPRPIRQIIPEVPQWLCDLISRLHAKEPAQRFQSAAQVASLLEQHLASMLHPSLYPRPENVKPRPRSNRPRVIGLSTAVAAFAILDAVITYPLWGPRQPMSGSPGTNAPGQGVAQAQTPASLPAQRAADAPLRTEVLQGRTAVRDALIDFTESERSFGSTPRDNAVRRFQECNAFLVRFDLARLDLPPKARVEKATASFYVWDPSNIGKTRVCAFPLKTDWDEVAVTWREPAVSKSWQGGKGFAFGADTGPATQSVIVLPEQGNDTADPPIEYQVDVTDLVRAWLDGSAPNYGLAIAPVIDSKVDEGVLTRFQVLGSEYGQTQYTPKLTVQIQP
jgi:hypothetical protein